MLTQNIVESLMGKWFNEKVVGPGFHRLDSGLHRTKRGKKDDWNGRLGPPDVMEQLDAIHSRHFQVGNDCLNASGGVFQLGSCVDSVRRSLNCVTFVTQGGFKSRQHLDVIIYYK